MKVYFDNAASSPVREEVIDTMIRVARDCFGNPSSRHQQGRAAAAELTCARTYLAAASGAEPDEIYFTSGGTEANNMAVTGCAQQLIRRGGHIITSAIEHDSVLRPIEKLAKSGWEVTYLAPESDGSISIETFAAALREDTVFVSIMLVNNETGSVNPISNFSAEIKRRGLPALLHTDAVQALCKIPFSVNTLGADLLTVSAHKLNGPKGAGSLFIRKGVKIKPLLLGGGQENVMRSGTESLITIAGFGESARLAAKEFTQYEASVCTLKKHISDRIISEIPEAVIISSSAGSPFIVSLSLPGFKSEVLMNYLDNEGICVSNGAACKKGARSHVLKAMNISNPIIDGAIRISFSQYNTIEEADYFVDKLKNAAVKLLKPL